MEYKFAKTMGIFETRHFEFAVFGDSRYSCIQKLRKAWKEHCRTHPTADPHYLDNKDGSLEDNMTWYDEIRSGKVFRDGEVILCDL